MLDDLQWLGLDWDQVEYQNENTKRYATALDTLAAKGALYPCSMSRAQIKRLGRPSPDGGYVYPNSNRHRSLPKSGWRDCREPLRAKLPDKIFTPIELSGADLSQNPGRALGDPVVRTRDGHVAYNLAAVVDDAASGVTHVIRGQDIAPSTATQCALMELLDIEAPTHRHHFLLLEPRGDKLAKLHGSIDSSILKAHYNHLELSGWLAHVAGLAPNADGIAPQALVDSFRWENVRQKNAVVRWNASASRLEVGACP